MMDAAVDEATIRAATTKTVTHVPIINSGVSAIEPASAKNVSSKNTTVSDTCVQQTLRVRKSEKIPGMRFDADGVMVCVRPKATCGSIDADAHRIAVDGSADTVRAHVRSRGEPTHTIADTTTAAAALSSIGSKTAISFSTRCRIALAGIRGGMIVGVSIVDKSQSSLRLAHDERPQLSDRA
jgi:hypothetical protein